MEFLEMFLCVFLGVLAGRFFIKKEKTAVTEPKKEREEQPEEEQLNPMALRNGYNVTRCENPTFAEQIVNVMNYSGENQKEEDYEESGN